MTPQQADAAEIAAFIRLKGVTRCPTACAAPSQATGSAVDRAALRQRAEQSEATRALAHQAWQRASAGFISLPVC